MTPSVILNVVGRKLPSPIDKSQSPLTHGWRYRTGRDVTRTLLFKIAINILVLSNRSSFPVLFDKILPYFVVE